MKTLEKLRARYRKARKELDAANTTLEAHLRPLVVEAIQAGDFDKALDLALSGESSVGQCFLLDTKAPRKQEAHEDPRSYRSPRRQRNHR
jgi:hypothetical protein